VLVIALALVIGFIITAIVSDEPVAAYAALLIGPLTGLNRFGNWLEESTTLILLGLAVALVFQARQFSLGAEGQMILGGMAAGVVALRVSAPPWLHVPLALAAAALTGFLWGLIPGLLKAHLNVDEIVSTLMLNVIALQLYNLLLIYWLRDPSVGLLGTEIFPASGSLPLLIPGTRVTIMLLITLGAVAATWFLMRRTPFGYSLKILGSNSKFAAYGGINTKRIIALSMAYSGVLAGLAGAHLTLGLIKRLQVNLSSGLGFEGIVVALLARNDPIGVVVTGLFYGYLRTGAQIMDRTTDVTREMVLIIQAVIILLITAERLFPFFQSWRARRKPLVALPAAETQQEGAG
jgi:simple sugar transport system permease protein